MGTRASQSNVFDENSMPTLRVAGRGRGGEPPSLGRVDHYRIVRKLGGGGFGVVYLAYDTVSGMEVAIKTIHPLLKNDDEAMEQLRRKFALVARLAHPHIATALVLHPVREIAIVDETARRELQLSPGESVMVMRYAPGITLSRWRRQFPEGRVPAEAAVGIARQIADALDYAHSQQIIHRDVKPANVMVETMAVEGGGGGAAALEVRILDFGLAAEIRSSMSRHSNAGADTSGTRPYMAPEQWAGKKQDGRTDQYALACVVYELLSGTPPFAGAFDSGDPAVMAMAVEYRAPERIEGLSAKANDVLGRALAKKPDERFGTCGAFVETLASALGVAGESGAGTRAGAAFGCGGASKGWRRLFDADQGIGALFGLRGGGGGGRGILSGKRLAVGLAVVAGVVVLWAGLRHVGKSPEPKSAPVPSVADVPKANSDTPVPAAENLEKELQRLVPGDDAGLEELVAARTRLEAFRVEHPKLWRPVKDELEALDERIEVTCKGKLDVWRGKADELFRQVDEDKYRRWKDREKLPWEEEKSLTDNEFTRRFAAIDEGRISLRSLEANPDAVKRGEGIVERLERDVEWIRGHEAIRGELDRLEQECTKQRKALLVSPDRDVDSISAAVQAMKEAKNLRDAGRFDEAGRKYGEVQELFEKAEQQTAKNRESRLAREELDEIREKVGGYDRAAQEWGWRDKASAVRMAAIRGAARTLKGISDEDADQCVEKARGLEAEARAASEWMRDNMSARKKAAEAEKALSEIVAETAGSPVEARSKKRFAESDKLAEDARRQLNEGRFEEAAETFAKARNARRAALAKGYLEMAREHGENGRYREGLEAAAKAQEVHAGAAGAADKVRGDIRKRLDGRIEEMAEQTGAARDRVFDPALSGGQEPLRIWKEGVDRAKTAAEEAERHQKTGDCEAALHAIEGYGEALRLFERAEQLAEEAAEAAERQARELKDEELLQAKLRCLEDIANLRDELGEYERKLPGFGMAFDPAQKKRIEKALGKAEESLRDERCEEASQALGEARAAFEEVRNATRVDPADGRREALEIRDIRDKAGTAQCVLWLVYDKKAGRWTSEGPIVQGQWLAVAPAPHRFWPEGETLPANFVIERDVREWTRKLSERPECGEWRFDYTLTGAGNNNERRQDARFTLIAWPAPP